MRKLSLFIFIFLMVLPGIVLSDSKTPTRINFSLAAIQNARLKLDLSWTFGGKQQQGWYLYTPLINQTIGSDKSTDSVDFATALSNWQKSVKLAPSGVLDDGTWQAMIRTWQSRLTRGRVRTIPDELFIAPTSDFYDPGRLEELRKVEHQTYAAYKRMIAAAMVDPSLKLTKKDKYLKIVSAFRPQEYQDNLLKKFPNASSAALSKISPHLTGRALDLYVGGVPTSTKDTNRAIQIQTPAYQWLVKNAEKFNFYPYFYEPWHWEYLPNKS
jgi:zinc D-Ala-D-Ala carboxypeptidase